MTNNNPLVGKTLVWTYKTGYPGASFEVNFISSSKKTSKGMGTAAGYSATHIYELAIVAPDTYMLSWMEESGVVLSVVLNLEEMKVYATFSTTKPERVFMTGVIDKIR